MLRKGGIYKIKDNDSYIIIIEIIIKSSIMYFNGLL